MKPDRYSHITDQQLLDHFYADHDNQWLGILLQRYTLLLLGVSMKYLRNEEEAKDSVQQIFLKTIMELHKYKVEYFKSWLYMVAKNHCLMRIREKNGKNSTAIQDQMNISDNEAFNVHYHIEKERQLELMTTSLEELSPEQKHCITMFYLGKKSYQEIANGTGYTVMQVKSYIQNGKRNLKNSLERKIHRPDES